MKTFSRLSLLTLLFLGIALMLVGGTAYAQSLEVYTAAGQAGYDIGDLVKVTFVVDPSQAVSLEIEAVDMDITHISGATAPYTIPGNYITDARAGSLVIEGILLSSCAYISARWDRGPDDDLHARAHVAGCIGADRVFSRYSTTFQHPNVYKFFPDVLRAFKNPEIQNVLNSVVIHHFVRDPEYIRAFYPDVDESIITLLTTDNGFRTLFEDEGFQGVLQEPAEIDELVRFIEAQPQREPRMLTIVSGDLQEGGLQTALRNPLVVLVRDQDGDALSGVDVTFRVTRGVVDFLTDNGAYK